MIPFKIKSNEINGCADCRAKASGVSICKSFFDQIVSLLLLECQDILGCFLVACTQLYNLPCWSVGWSVTFLKPGLRMRGIFEMVRVRVFQQLAHRITHRIHHFWLLTHSRYAFSTLPTLFFFQKERKKEREKVGRPAYSHRGQLSIFL